MASMALSSAELKGLGEIAKARRNNLQTMFEGTKLTFSKHALEKTSKNALSDGKSLGSAVKKTYQGLKSGSSAAAGVASPSTIESNGREFLSIAMSVRDYGDVVAAVHSEVLHSLISEMTPFLGILTSSVKAASSWKAVVANARDLYKADYYMQGVLPGDPSAAAAAVNTTVERFLAANTADATRNTASAATKVAGLFADLGTATTAAVGAASALAKLLQELAILGRDYKEMKAGNEILADPSKLDMDVFKVCPLLGCYLLSCSDTSNVANFFVADIGMPGWMDKVEKMKKEQLDPLIKNANKAIVVSHLRLDGLKSDKGTFKSKGTLDRLKDNLKYQFNQLVRSNASNAMKSA